MSELRGYGVKAHLGLDDPHSRSPGSAEKEEHLPCTQLLLPPRAVLGTWLLQSRGTFLSGLSISLVLTNQFSFVLPQSEPSSADQESEEQQQFGNIFRQIAGDVSTSNPDSHRHSSP